MRPNVAAPAPAPAVAVVVEALLFLATFEAFVDSARSRVFFDPAPAPPFAPAAAGGLTLAPSSRSMSADLVPLTGRPYRRRVVACQGGLALLRLAGAGRSSRTADLSMSLSEATVLSFRDDASSAELPPPRPLPRTWTASRARERPLLVEAAFTPAAGMDAHEQRLRQ